MTKYFIIANPATGRRAGERAVPKVMNYLKNHEADVQVVQTERPWHRAELAREAAADRRWARIWGRMGSDLRLSFYREG